MVLLAAAIEWCNPGEYMFGWPVFHSINAGRGAAVGRFMGTVAKIAIGMLMVVMPGVADFLQALLKGSSAQLRIAACIGPEHSVICGPVIIKIPTGRT